MMFSRFQDYRVLESIADCYRVLKSVREFYNVLQSVTECYRVLQSLTEYFQRIYLDQFLGLFWLGHYPDKLKSHLKNIIQHHIILPTSVEVSIVKLMMSETVHQWRQLKCFLPTPDVIQRLLPVFIGICKPWRQSSIPGQTTGCLKKVLPNKAFADPASDWREILLIFVTNPVEPVKSGVVGLIPV